MNINDTIPYYWKAEYNDETNIFEYENIDDKLVEHSFKEIQKENVKTFSLVGKHVDINFNTKDGIFNIINQLSSTHIKPIIYLKSNDNEEALEFSKPFNDIIQYKGFYVDGITPGIPGNYQSQTVSYHIGWKNKINVNDITIDVKIIFSIILKDKVKLEFKVTANEDIDAKIELNFTNKKDEEENTKSVFKPLDLKKNISDKFEFVL